MINDSSTSTPPAGNRWLLHPQLLGPVIAAILAIEFGLSLCANLFISIYTLYNAKRDLRKSSTVLLFNLALSDLLVTVFYMPFVIATLAAEEWLIGRTDSVKEGFCQFNGFISTYSNSVSVNILAAISFDRFLFIVKPQVHERWMTWKVTLWIVISIWVSPWLLLLFCYTNVGIEGIFHGA